MKSRLGPVEYFPPSVPPTDSKESLQERHFLHSTRRKTRSSVRAERTCDKLSLARKAGGTDVNSTAVSVYSDISTGIRIASMTADEDEFTRRRQRRRNFLMSWERATARHFTRHITLEADTSFTPSTLKGLQRVAEGETADDDANLSGIIEQASRRLRER